MLAHVSISQKTIHTYSEHKPYTLHPRNYRHFPHTAHCKAYFSSRNFSKKFTNSPAQILLMKISPLQIYSVTVRTLAVPDPSLEKEEGDANDICYHTLS